MGDQTKGIQVGPCTDEGGGCRSRGLAPVGFTVRALRVISASRALWVMKLRRISSPRHDGLCLLWRRSDRWLRAPLDRQVRGASRVKSAMCGDRLVAAAAESSESDRSRIFPSSSKSRSFRARARSLGRSSAPTFEEESTLCSAEWSWRLGSSGSCRVQSPTCVGIPNHART